MIVDDAKVDFGILEDKTIATDKITSGVSGQYIGWFNSTLDHREKVKPAYLEQDYWLLDGSFVIPFYHTNGIDSDASFEDGLWDVDGNGVVEINKSNAYIGENSLHVNGATVSLTKESNVDLYMAHQRFVGFYVKNAIGDSYPNVINVTVSGDGKTTIVETISRGNAQNGWFFTGESCRVKNSSGNDGVVRINSIGGSSNFYLDGIVLIDMDYLFPFGVVGAAHTTSEYNELRGFLVDFFCSSEAYLWWDGEEGNYHNQGVAAVNVDEPFSVIYKFTEKHDSYGITLKFSPTSIAKDFDIHYFSGDAEIGTLSIRDNDKETYIDRSTNLQWDKVAVDIITPQEGQRARLQEIIFGAREEIDGDDLLSIEATRTFSPTAEYAESGEVTFSFFNDGRYPIKTIKDLSQNIFGILKMDVYFREKGKQDYTYFSTYYSESAKVEERGRVITFTGHDIMYRLDDIMFTSGRIYDYGPIGPKMLAEWAQDVAKVAGVEIGYIDDEVGNELSLGYIPEVPCREAFRLIAEAGNGFVVVENNAISIYSRKNGIIDAGILIDDSKIVDKSFSLNNQNKYMGVRVTEYKFVRHTSTEEIGRIENLSISNNELQTMDVEFSTSPVDPETVRVETTGGSVTILEKTTSRVKFSISSDSRQEVTISIYGVGYDVVENKFERGETQKDVKDISGNFLITQTMGERVAESQNEYAVNKYNYTAEVCDDSTTPVVLREQYEMQGENVIITEHGYSLSYGSYSENIKGVER